MNEQIKELTPTKTRFVLAALPSIALAHWFFLSEFQIQHCFARKGTAIN